MMTQTNAPNIEAARSLANGGPVLYPGSTIETKLLEIADLDFEWTCSFLGAESEVEELSWPTARHLFNSKALTVEEEQAITNGESPEIADPAASRLYELAAGEALALLKQYAQSNPYRSARLRARVCAAIRAELAALVEDWDAVNGGAE